MELWGDEEIFCSIRNLTKFELVYKQDEFIYKMNDHATSLYVIQSGAIKLEKKMEDGSNHVSGFYFTGDLIGLESLGLEQYNYNAIALKETWVCEIRTHKLATLGESSLPVLKKINMLLSRRLREIDDHLYSTRNLYTEQRLLCFLNALCKKNIEPINDSSDLFYLPMSKADIANYLGMRAESLSRAFRQFENLEIVKSRQTRRATVINKQKLLKLCDIFGKGKSGAAGNCL
ncbi:MAG: Crp/Fnr family transcriptional regulator [Gammaproteobacteria bacterium]|nr:Crp/Fnr family transcriptional regulator [Gammaproteobacteria bacterium]